MKKVTSFFKKARKKVAKYLSSNKLFLLYVIFSMVITVTVRHFTIGNTFDYRPFICDLALVVIIGAFGYFIKPRKQFTYYFIWMFIYALMGIINSVYYVFYTSFASVSLLSTLGLVGDVGDSLTEKLRVIDFVYLLGPIMFYMIHIGLKKKTYYQFVAKVENGKKMFASTLLAGIIILSFTLVNMTGTDASRLVKQWNREYIVQRFGIILYHGNDLVQSLTPKINSLFGYDEAAKSFREYFAEKELEEKQPNKYTGVLEGMNVIFIHLESVHNYLIDMEINGTEVTPTINELADEGMYFSNFYPQISVGTSSDTEFTLNTSLMPASSSTVFMSYFDRNYVTIEKLLADKGYYTFSAHANEKSMWNRDYMHPNMGYQEMIFKDQFVVTPETIVGLGLSDEEFFRQLQPKLEKIEDENENYMGTLIQLSNHSPFAGTEVNPELYDSLGSLDLTNTYVTVDEDGNEVTVTDDYLKGTKLGNYLITAHYADLALGQFFDYVRESDYYDNTVFVLYGDHEARLAKKEYSYYYNYDKTTGIVKEEGDEGYYDFDNYQYELNKSTPFIIWTKNKKVARKIVKTNDNVMGMYDVMPTLGNMLGYENKYALGHDIYDIGENNVVVFPSGDFVTNKVYYNNTKGAYATINRNSGDQLSVASSVIIEDNYIENLKKYTEDILNLSNDIIVHDLIYKEGDYFEKPEEYVEEGVEE